MTERPLLSPKGFAALERWVKAEAKLVMAERTYKNDRAIGEVATKAGAARQAAYAVLVQEAAPPSEVDDPAELRRTIGDLVAQISGGRVVTEGEYMRVSDTEVWDRAKHLAGGAHTMDTAR